MDIKIIILKIFRKLKKHMELQLPTGLAQTGLLL
jgi:hypothetical protein